MSVYITSGFDGVNAIKERVTCDFTKHSFDLKIKGWGTPPRNYRLFKDKLEKEIDPAKSKLIVKKSMIKIKSKSKNHGKGRRAQASAIARVRVRVRAGASARARVRVRVRSWGKSEGKS